MAKKNEAIGEVECPAKACPLKVPVYRFRERPTETMRRFAGKLYCRCPEHGTFGGASGDSKMQEYLLEHSTIWGAKKPAAKIAEPTLEDHPNQPASMAKETPAIPQKLPAAPAKKKAPASPAIKAPAVPAAEPAVPAKRKPTGFGFFE